MKFNTEDPYEWEMMAGEWIDEWIDRLPVDGIFRRKPDEEDFDLFMDNTILWVFTQRGQRLYDSIVSKVNKLGEKIFEGYGIDVSRWTGVVEP